MGFPEIVEILLQHPKINVNIYDRGNDDNRMRSALYWAVTKKHAKVCKVLLDNPQTHTGIIGKHGNTILMSAIKA